MTSSLEDSQAKVVLIDGYPDYAARFSQSGSSLSRSHPQQHHDNGRLGMSASLVQRRDGIITGASRGSYDNGHGPLP
jgi:hypothetical protein